MRKVSYGDELYLLTLVLRELDHASRIGIETSRFLDRLQADIAFLDEALGDYHAVLTANTQLPGNLEYLRRLCRLQADFAAYLTQLSRPTTALGRAFAPLRETFGQMERRHAQLAGVGRRVLADAGGERGQERHGISDEEFRILLSPDEPG